MTASGPEAPPLAGVRVVEFGQLLAGPFVGTLLGDFGADVVKVEAPPARRPDARLGPAAPQRPLAVVVDPRAQQALGHAEPARGAPARQLAGAAVRGRRRGARELPARARWRSWGLGPAGRPRGATRAPIYARVSGYGQTGRYRDRPGLRARPARRSAGCATSTAIPDQAPPRTGISLGDTLAAQSAFQGILLALYARDARGAGGPGRRRLDHRRVLRDDRVVVVEYEKTGFVREPTGTAAAAHRAVERLPLQRRALGRHRGQPRHAVAAAGGADGPARARPTTSASPPTTRAASTRTCSTR